MYSTTSIVSALEDVTEAKATTPGFDLGTRLRSYAGEREKAINLLYNPDPVLIGLYVPVLVMSIVANVLLIIIVVKFQYMRNVTNIFLVNLAVADLLVTLLCMPIQLGKAVTLVWFYGELMCKMVNYFQGVSVAASVFTLAAMSVDRYVAIAQCFSVPRNMIDRTSWHRALLAVLWLVALATFSPLLVVAVTKEERVPVLSYTHNETMPEDESIIFCTEDWSKISISRNAFGIFSFILVYSVPGIIMAVAYSLMGMRLCSIKPPFDRENGETNNRQGLRLVKERKRVAWILLLLAVLFAVCWLPYNTIQLLLDTGFISTESVSGALPYALLLGHTNSAINPMVYCLMTRNFKKSLKKLLCKRTIDLSSRQQQRIRCVAAHVGTSSSGYDSYHEPHRKCYLQVFLDEQPAAERLLGLCKPRSTQERCSNHPAEQRSDFSKTVARPSDGDSQQAPDRQGQHGC